MATTAEIEQLAATIGEEVYLEVAKWRLYLNDAHLHTSLAEQLVPLLESNALDRENLRGVLRSVTVPLGGGKLVVPLLDLIPDRLVDSLQEVLEKYCENLSP